MNTNRRSITCIACVIGLLALVGAEVNAQTIVNGSMAGTPGLNSLATSWTGFSADLYAPGGIGGYAQGAPASPDGGNFASIAVRPAYPNEYIGQTVSGLAVGVPVQLTFWVSNLGYEGGGGPYPSDLKPGGITVNFGAESQMSPVFVHNGFGGQTWHQVTMTFTPTATSAALAFYAYDADPGSGGSSYARLGIDGVSFGGVVPVETSTWGSVKALYR